MLNTYGNILGILIKDSPIKSRIKWEPGHRKSSEVSDINLIKSLQADWKLPRQGSSGINGYSYQGFYDNIGDIDLGKKVHILGFNPNIQSSFDVTLKV